MKNHSIIKLTLGLLAFTAMTIQARGQKNFNDYLQVYPIGESPNISFRTSYVRQETILFDANPLVRLSFSNNFIKGFINGEKHMRAWYLSFRPQLRMYTERSFPVKTPSYRVFLATQHLFRLARPAQNAEQFIGFSLESGHYSNGQSGCSFCEGCSGSSRECDSVSRLITPQTDLSKILNRSSGDFSTNLTEIILNYQYHRLDEDNITDRSHSVRLGAVIYHDRFLGMANFGGYGDQDIKIYGRMRYLLGYSFGQALRKGKRIMAEENIEFIHKPHPSVNPWRLESSFTVFPFQHVKALGLFVSYIYGHDNYNYRFVDAGHQGALGITWSQFPPVTMRKGF